MSHRTAFRIALAPIVLAGALTFGCKALAHEGAPSAGTGVKAEILTWLLDAEDKLGQLAEAIPESKYGWSPSKDVRTVREVFMHVAAANYCIPDFIGIKAPEGFDFGAYEKSLTKKSDVMKALKDSFAHMKAGLTAMSDADMDKPAEFFGMKMTHRGTYMLLMSHAHEHLGQAIAYARSIGVTPPWTAKEQAEEAKAKKK